MLPVRSDLSKREWAVFDPRISGDAAGVNNMQIFCFDTMLMLLSLKRGGREPFSHCYLFDGSMNAVSRHLLGRP